MFVSKVSNFIFAGKDQKYYQANWTFASFACRGIMS